MNQSKQQFSLTGVSLKKIPYRLLHQVAPCREASIRLVLLAATVVMSAIAHGFGGPSAHLASLPLCFEANLGQVDPAVQFLAHGRGYALYLTSTEAVLTLSRSRLEESGAQARGIRDDASFLRMEFIGANPAARMAGVAELAGKVNYLWGSDPAQWHTNVATYSKVQCAQVYPGIDLIYYGSDQRQLEFDWVVAPGANPKVITLSLEGANCATVDPTGDLILQAGGGEIRQHRPIIYQWVDGARRVVDGGYIVTEAASMAGRDEARVRRWLVSFNILAYDLARPLVIDPVLSYATFLGGSANEYGAGIAVDPPGNVYITGRTDSLDFPPQNPITDRPDTFVVKLNPQGSGFVYATYFGGSGRAIAVDATGNAYITGEASAYLPVVKAFQDLCGGCWDAFLTKLSADGATVLYSTYLGGSGCDSGAAVAVDAQQNAYVTGVTSSPDWPTRSAMQTDFHGGGSNNPNNYKGDAFVAKIDTTATGSVSLAYSTYLGGNDNDVPNGIAVDAAGNAYVAGYTASTNFPMTVGAFQPSFAGGDYDVFVTKLDPSGTALVYSTYLGGSGNDNNNNGGGCIALDAAGNAFVTGQSYSSDFPTKNAWQPTMINRFQPNLSGYGFVSKLNADGSALVYSTFLLGFGYTAGVAVDQAGSVYVAGLTVGNLPVVNAVQTNYAGGNPGDWEGCLLKLDPDGQSALYATYLGGTSSDGCTGIAVDRDGNAYVTGYTSSTNFPTRNALQPAFGGGPGDGFVVKISDPDTTPPVLLAASNYGDAAVVTVDFSEALDVASATNATHYTMDHGVTVNSVTMDINSRTMRLLTTGLTNGVAYTLTVNGVLDRAPVPNPIAPDTHVTFTALGLYRGFLHQEVYAGIDGGNLADLTNNVKYPNQPDTSNYVHQSEILSYAASQCGTRLTGYLIPPMTGEYTFYLCSGQGALFLSKNESPLNAVQIAFEPGSKQARRWNHPIAGYWPSPLPNLSLPVHLEVGRAYYVEALAQSGGGNILGVNWREPGQPEPQNGDPPIAGNFLAVLGNPQAATLTIVQQPQDASVAEGLTAAFSVKATASPAGVFYQWRTNGVEIPGANGPSFITSEATLVESGVFYDCVLTIPGATATTRAALLTVTNDVTPPALVSAEGNLTWTHLTLMFSEPVNVADATNPANYTLSGGLVVSNAVLLLDRQTVILTTSPQTPGSNYTVQVSGVRDRSAAANTMASGVQASFFGWVDEEFVGPFPSWANVKSAYGAIGDGVADDTAALQQALNEVATPGHATVLYFPAGTYRITQTLNLNSRISASLVGEDPLTTIIEWDGPTDTDMMFANSVTMSRWTRLTWDGSGKALGAVHHGFTSGAYQVTGNLHTDEIFKDIFSALYADPANGGDSHLVVRCHFLRCFNGIALGSYNAIDWHVWDSVFEDCSYGLHAYVGNFHVYRSLFLRSTVADVHCKVAYYGIRGNMSIGSKTFVEGGDEQMTIQGNTVVDSLDPISVSGGGPMILLDNTFRSRADATNGPVVNVEANLLSVGNTFTLERPTAVAGRSITMADRVVNRDSFDLPPLMTPAFLPKLNRPIIEVVAGTNAMGIQQAIDTAASLNGLRPVVHLPAANYYVDRTLLIPAGCDLQLVGDGYGGQATTLYPHEPWSGPPGGPVLRLAGPSRATLREFQISGGNRSALGLVVDNCDQPGARVFMEKVDLGDNGVNSLLVDRLDHTDVSLHDFFHGSAREVSLRVIGGAAQAAGQTTSGRVDLFGGAAGGGALSYQVERGGRLLVQDCWFEAGPGFMHLTDSGTLALNNAQICPGDEAHTHGGPNGAVELDDFHGQVSFLNTSFTQTSALIKGDGSATDLLLLGCNGYPDNTPPKPLTYLDNQSPHAHVEHLMSASSGLEIEDVGGADPVFLRKMLAQLRTETPRRLVPLPPEVTDVRIFRVSTRGCRTAMKLTGTNAAPQLVPIPAEYVIDEGTTLTFTNQATDPDLPFDSFTFTLGPGAPVNIILNPTNGVLAWTPIESQGPSTNRIQIIIGDDGSPRLFVTNAITITVLESNLPPTLGVLGITTNVALENLVNIDTPDTQRLPPSWESLGNGNFNVYAGGNLFYAGYSDDSATFAYQRVKGDFDARVRLASFEALRPETRAGLVVRETLDSYSRTLHVLAQPDGVTQDGRSGYGYFQTIQRATTGGWGDRWDSGYGGGKVSLPHAWMRLRRQSQTFTAYWSDDGINWIQIGQHDATSPYPSEVFVGLGMTSGYNWQNAHFEFRDFQNVFSVLAPIPDAIVNEGELLTFEVNASDPDLPEQVLTYSLEPGAPTGAAINPSHGVFTWTPTEAQGSSTNRIGVIVTDDGSPPLSATNILTVVVNDVNAAPVLTLPPNTNLNELVPFTAMATASDADIPPNTLTFALVSGPAGLTVSTGGVINWTPNEFQGPSTNLVTVRVFDDGVPSLSATQSFTVIVTEVNTVPVLTVITDQTLAEGATLALTVTATDADLPANTLTYSLTGAPASMTINPVTGQITWTPTEAQGPSTNIVTVRVTDDGAPALSDTKTFTVVVTEVNTAPVLAAIADQTINELATLTVTNSAIDADIPANTLTYALRTPAAGATISANGVVTWTPTEVQGPSTNTITTVVTDSGSPPFSATNAFTVIVNEVNVAPVLTLPPNTNINELAPFTAMATATDADIPTNTLTFALVSGPTGLTVSTNGVINWTPDESQGPSTNLVTVRVFDDGVPSLSATQSFTVIVSEVNVAPGLTTMGDRTVNPGQTISFTATAIDSDIPTNTLVFRLVSPPAGASIDAGNGRFNWRPPVALADTTNVVQVQVTDDSPLAVNAPRLSDTKSFTLVVNRLMPVVLTPIGYTNGQFQMKISGPIGPDYILQASLTLTNWSNLWTNTPAALPFSFTDTNVNLFGGRFYRALLGP